MAFAVGGKVEGVEELVAALKGVEKKIARRALKKAINEASKIILRKARNTVQKDSGLLRKSLGRKVKVYRPSGAVTAIIGPRVGFREEVTRKGRSKPVMANPTKYSHLVEKGTSHSKPYPFLGPAFETTKTEVASKIADIVARELK